MVGSGIGQSGLGCMRSFVVRTKQAARTGAESPAVARIIRGRFTSLSVALTTPEPRSRDSRLRTITPRRLSEKSERIR
jgi:hypothetical protein